MGVLGASRTPSVTVQAKTNGAPAEPLAKPAARASSAPPPPQQTLTKDMGPGVGTKTYTFPSKFREVELLRAEFELPSSVVRRWLPPDLKPASADGETKALVTFQTMGKPPDNMAPYHEAQFAVRVIGPDQKEGWHVLTMPVDSLENQRRGELIFGYPKEMSQVSMTDSLFTTTGEAKTPSGEPLFSLSVGPTFPIGRSVDKDDQNYQTFNKGTVRMSSSGKGEFKLGLARIEFSQAMRDRFKGLPAEPDANLRGTGRLEDGEILLGLPDPV